MLVLGLGLGLERPNPLHCFIITRINAVEFDPDLFHFPLCTCIYAQLTVFTDETSPG